jgi:phosphopantothenoylcysteine decarboxylase/phosphopantothenate--cysteine ligase
MLVALGIGGGISAYKACEIVRGLDRAGIAVQVLMTRNATRFITPLTLQTLSRRRVLSRAFDLDDERTVRHIELAREAAALVVAPATADIVAKLARGLADDLLSTFALSVTGPLVLAPAMNSRMWLHPATQDNVALLRARGVRLVEPEVGWLAEEEHGVGRMAEPATIVEATLAAARRSRQLAGQTIVVSAGPTREPLDPVRFVSNRSSGKMGYAVAAAAARRGARVLLVSGPVDLAVPWGVERIRVTTSAEMREALLAVRGGARALFMAAAVSDFVPQPARAKIKRAAGPLALTLDEGPDILAELGRERRESLLVGFAAETENLVEHAREKLERKNVDAIVANDVSRPGLGIDAEDNEVTILERGGALTCVGPATKAEIAEALLDHFFGADEAR